ncbi:hypothetical protein EJ03DRAFT_140990 [Teratosphaeria nubilosa]|uniref:C2H2-type domain-containing protein n=1 Tax=Teratosphaeria nubilosa TaxID=161662 RepID=A0A6G1L5J0_9PEZI|nr:hypothetical protein EJ03DRAFT_140990 [Teratosphaeria nubilosa]
MLPSFWEPTREISCFPCHTTEFTLQTAHTTSAIPSSANLPIPETHMHEHPSHIEGEKDYMQQARVRQRPSSGGSGSIHSSQPPAKKQRLESCAVCGTTYTTKRALARHCHTDRHRQNAGLPLAEKHPCSMCEKVFSREHDRLRHESETHRGVKRTARKGQDSDVSPQSSSIATDSPATPTVATIVYRKEKSFMVEHDAPASHDDWEQLSPKVEMYSGSAERLPSYEDIVREPISGSNTPQPQVARPKPNLVEVSWLAEASEDESEAEDASSMDHDGSLRSMDSTIADSAVDLGSARRTESQQSLRSCSLGEEDRVDPRFSTADIQLAECQVILPLRPRATMIHRAAGGTKAPTADTIPARKTHICALCEKALEDDTDDLLAHLRHHLAGFKGEYVCQECDIGFGKCALDFATTSTSADHSTTTSHSARRGSTTPSKAGQEDRAMRLPIRARV